MINWLIDFKSMSTYCGLFYVKKLGIAFILHLSYLRTPPLGQDMTQGQFFKRSLTGFNSEFSFS